MSRMHQKINQLDGDTDGCLDHDAKYNGSKYYWMKGWFAVIYMVGEKTTKSIEYMAKIH